MNKRKLQNILLLCATILIILLALEIFFRIAGTELNRIKPDPNLVYRYIPGKTFSTKTGDFVNNISLNSYGFNDKEWMLSKHAGKRILIIGDSFTEGYHVSFEKQFARRLEKELPETELLSAGVSSWDTSTEMKYLELEGLSFEPDVVILQMYIGNDIYDNYVKGLFSIENGELRDNTPVKISSAKRIMLFLSTYSALAKRVADFLTFSPLGMRVTRALGGTATQETADDACTRYMLFTREKNAEYTEGFAIMDKLLDRFALHSKKNNYVPILLVIPMKEQVVDSLWKYYSKEYEEKCGRLGTLQRDLPQAWLAENAPDIILIDAYPVLRQKDANNTFYFENNLHLNEKGHELLSEILAGHLQSKT